MGILVSYLLGLPYQHNTPQAITLGGADISWWRPMFLFGVLPAIAQVLSENGLNTTARLHHHCCAVGILLYNLALLPGAKMLVNLFTTKASHGCLTAISAGPCDISGMAAQGCLACACAGSGPSVHAGEPDLAALEGAAGGCDACRAPPTGRTLSHGGEM